MSTVSRVTTDEQQELKLSDIDFIYCIAQRGVYRATPHLWFGIGRASESHRAIYRPI